MKEFFANRFEGKAMIVTGAARGIGEAVALRAAQEGARLMLADRREAEGLQVLEAVRALGAEAEFLALDLSVEESAQTLVERTVERFGRLDEPDNVHNLSKGQMDYTMANNFYSVFFCCKHELRQFLAQGEGGAIVNNASIAGVTGLPGNPAYVASKHAVNGLTKNLALDYAAHGVRVNSVNPAGTTTPMVQEAYEYVMARQKEAIAAGADPAAAQSMAGEKQNSMLRREALPEEQAASILFLASDDASHMTGAIVATDGGWTSF